MFVRTRFAPSPTGFVHIGSVQKMLYSYALARKFNGKYILRIEDTDRSRYLAAAEDEIYRVHELLGFVIDESPQHEGELGPYRQSERLDLYRKYAQELVARGHAYYAFESSEELAQMRISQQEKKEQPRYNGKYRDYPLAEAEKRINAKEKYVIRIKVPDNRKVVVDDLIMGKIEFNTSNLDDYILVKSDGYPTYHLAVVVDDYLMQISHVFRGVEWIPTSAIHMLLFEFFGWSPPKFAHVPNLLDPSGGKLSKRKGSVALMDYLRKGYLQEAILNYMMLMAWSPKSDREIYSLQEFIDIFNLENFNKGNPVFDLNKLNWFNQHYIRELTVEDLMKRIIAWLELLPEVPEVWEEFMRLTESQRKSILAMEQERLASLEDIFSKVEVFVRSPQNYDFETKQLSKMDSSQKLLILNRYLELRLNLGNDFNHDKWEAMVRQVSSELDIQAGKVFMSIRVAITGRAATPPLFDIISVIGGDAELDRIRAAINYLETSK